MYTTIRWFALAVMLSLHVAAPAQQRGTPEEAKAMVANAIIMFDADPRGSMALFNDPAGGFRDRDLYLFVIGPDAKVVAHALDRKRVGIDVRTVRDSKDRPYGRMIIDSATHEGVWVDYIRTDPLTGEDHDKSSWVVRYKDHVFGVGVYR